MWTQFIQGVDLPRGRGERFIVYSGGKLEHRKGQDIVVAAFREFVKTHPDAVLATTWHNQWPMTMAGMCQMCRKVMMMESVISCVGLQKTVFRKKTYTTTAWFQTT